MKKNKPCPRCKTPMALEEGQRKCLSCGYIETSNAERHKFYEAHKQEILEDLGRLGLSGIQKKWGMPYSSWHQLKVRWGVEQPAQQPAPEQGIQINSQLLPALPAFNNEWLPEVQVKWLEVWAGVQSGAARLGVAYGR